MVTRQQLIRDLTQLLKTRGLRLAALGGTGANSDWYKVYTHVAGNLAAPSASVYRIVLDFDNTKLTALSDERMVGAENSVIPIPDRV